jgi:hypothetical protein
MRSIWLCRYQMEESNDLSSHDEQLPVAENASIRTPLLPDTGVASGISERSEVVAFGSELTELPCLSQLVRFACVPGATRDLQGPILATDLLSKLAIVSFLLCSSLFGLSIWLFSPFSIKAYIQIIYITILFRFFRSHACLLRSYLHSRHHCGRAYWHDSCLTSACSL